MTCLARVKHVCSNWESQTGVGVFSYDSVQGQACVTAMRTFSCAQGRGFTGGAVNFDFGNGPPACDLLLDGVGVAGTPCNVNADCADGFACSGATNACSTCTALPTAGQACNLILNNCYQSQCRLVSDGGSECGTLAGPNQPCTGFGTCDPATTRGCGPTPTDGGTRTCTPKDPDGATCTFDQTCASNYCNDGNRTDAGQRTCGTIATGRPCGSQTDCGPTAFCDGLTNTAPGVCTARLTLGTTCRIQRQADPNDGCADAGACFESICKPRVNQQMVGEQCRSTTLDCTLGSWCPALPNDGGYPLCRAGSMAGTMCGSSAECAPGLRCTNNTCQPLGSAGQACTSTQGCKDTLTCPQVDAGMGFFACTPLVSPGGDCSAAGTTCASGTDNGEGGFCARDAGGVGTCYALLMTGADCGFNNECESNRCLRADGGMAVPANRGTCQAPCVP
jgi:hypothetical protein